MLNTGIMDHGLSGFGFDGKIPRCRSFFGGVPVSPSRLNEAAPSGEDERIPVKTRTRDYAGLSALTALSPKGKASSNSGCLSSAYVSAAVAKRTDGLQHPTVDRDNREIRFGLPLPAGTGKVRHSHPELDPG